MNLARLKKYDDTVLTPEEESEIETIKKEGKWLSMEDLRAFYRVKDSLEHAKV